MKKLAIIATIIGFSAIILTAIPHYLLQDDDRFLIFIGKVAPLYSFIFLGPFLYVIEHKKHPRRKRH